MSDTHRVWAPSAGALLAMTVAAFWAGSQQFRSWSSQEARVCLLAGGALFLMSLTVAIALALVWSRIGSSSRHIASHFLNLLIGGGMLIAANANALTGSRTIAPLIWWWTATGFVIVALVLAVTLIYQLMIGMSGNQG